jgi:fatty-acyl-CoA synthase
MVAHADLGPSTVFLWTLPMFHCDGWCFSWAVTAAGGTHVELREVDPAAIWTAIRTQGVTHLNGPTVLISLASHTASEKGPAPQSIRVATGGAPPSPSLLSRLAELNFEVAHLYGLTETYGPAVICDPRPEWEVLGPGQRAAVLARQGVANLVSEAVRVIDVEGRDVPADGDTMGEVVLHGNNVMIGYFKDPAATSAASI